ncbi:hypothetical protein ACAG24_024750 [Mycobacterium sp. pW049]|uniref:hypothetical protein n=1 Tax=[Mycobacterium] bulgaricum TaxID=3238985 RepID=UPI00351BDD82
MSFKPVSSAKWVNVSRSWSGKVKNQVEHDTIRGVSPKMLRWWFQNASGMTTWNGKDFTGPEIPVNLLWHHRDHIDVTPLTDGDRQNEGFIPGGVSVIREQLSDYRDLIIATVHTDVLDDEAFDFRIMRFGRTVGRMRHRFSAEPNGSRLYAEIEIGVDIPVLGVLLNWLLVPLLFSKSTAERSIRHGIEEMGRLEQVLPPLYARAHRE